MVTGSKMKDMSTSIMHGKTLICGWSVIDRGWVGLKNNSLFKDITPKQMPFLTIFNITFFLKLRAIDLVLPINAKNRQIR